MKLEELRRLMQLPEGPQLEFKEAANQFETSKALEYLCAFANRGGGHLILGVSNRRPRRITATNAFPGINADLRNWQQRISVTIDGLELSTPEGRVVVLSAHGRAPGTMAKFDGEVYTRQGESIVVMPDAMRTAILLEAVDVTDEACPDATLEDLDSVAIKLFREGVVAKTLEQEQKQRYGTMPVEELLRDLGLIRRDGALNRAALLLLGKDTALRDLAPNAEVIFEYRRVPTAIRPDLRYPLRASILRALETLWDLVLPLDERVDVQHRSLVAPLLRYPERSVREALLNAFAHRDYHHTESILVRMTPETFEVTSPGPFLPPVTPLNIADEQERRNRRLAEALDRCGRIERSGQGVNLMMQAAVQQAQPLPTFEEPDGLRVRTTLHGVVDLRILPALQRIPVGLWNELSSHDLVGLDLVRQGRSRRDVPIMTAQRLLERGLVEVSGPGEAPLVLATEYLDPTAGGAPVARIIEALGEASDGLSLSELAEQLPEHSTEFLRRELQWLRRNGFIQAKGRTRATRWYLHK